MLRRLLLLLLLIILLAGAYGLNQFTTTWHYVQPVQAGQVEYAATFDQHIDDWGLYEGRVSAAVVDSALRLSADDIDRYPFSISKQHWRDFDFSVQATPVEGPDDNGYGVIFRLQTKGNTSPDDNDFYLFLISSDGYYRVVRSLSGETKNLSAWIPSDVIALGIGATNQVRVVGKGDQFQFYINGTPVQLCIPNNPDGISTYRDECIDGQMVDALTDASVADGQLGVVIQTLNEPGVVVDFDNVIVVGPEGA